MIDTSFVAALGKIAPERLQDLLAAIDLVANELRFAQDAVDSASKNAISHGHYDDVPELVNVSKFLKEYAERIDAFLDENSIEEAENDEGSFENEDTDKQADRTDYSKFNVDTTIAYDLFTPVTHKKPAAFTYKGRKYNTPTWGRMLTTVCDLLYKENKNILASFPDDKSMQGRRKPKFSTEKASLRNGVMVRNSGIYIETNLSANSVRKTILAMLDKYGIPSDAIKIYIRRDLTPLHKAN